MTVPDNLVARLRNTPTRVLIATLLRDGFAFSRSNGSHHLYKDEGGRRVVISYHYGNASLTPRTLRSFLLSTRWTLADVERLGLL